MAQLEPHDRVIETVATYFNHDPDWYRAVIRVESAFEIDPKPRWEPHKDEHSYGLGQFLPSTALWITRTGKMPVDIRETIYQAAELMSSGGEAALNRVLHDPSVAVYLIGSYLDYLLRRYDGDIVKAVAAYNAGSARYTSNGDFVNQWHVDKFLDALDVLKGV